MNKRSITIHPGMVLKQQRWFFQKGGQPAGTEAEQQESKGPVLKGNSWPHHRGNDGEMDDFEAILPPKREQPFLLV